MFTSYFVDMECWETRADSQGNHSRVCLRCLYYEGRHSGRIESSRKCWEYQNCQLQCRYRSNPNAEPPRPLPLKTPMDPRERLLRTAAQLKKLTAAKKPVPVKKPQNSEAAYKLIATILSTMLKESREKGQGRR